MLKCASLLLVGAHAADLSFLTLGDWGKVDVEQRKVAAAMADAAAALSPAGPTGPFVLGLGDNYYENGVTDVDDPQFQTTFADEYHGKYDSLQVPFYAVVGNHDHRSNASAQVEYSLLERDPFWTMPALSYSFEVPVDSADSSSTLEVVMVDTVTLCPDTTQRVIRERVPTGEYEQRELDEWTARLPELRAAADDQWAWLEGTLANSTADWLIVAGHYPVYSACEHGDTDELVSALVPLMDQYGVDAYLNGHDHCMQHLQGASDSDDGGVHYWGSGAGAKLGLVEHPRKDELVWGEARPGFMLHEISGDEMTVSIIGVDGSVMHEATQGRRTAQSAREG